LANNTDKGARFLSIVSLVVSILAVLVPQYYSSWKAADVKAGIGPHILLNKKPRIGVVCSFNNEGAKQATITTAKLKWDHPDETLLWQMTSTSAGEFQFDDKGQMKSTPTSFLPVVNPITIKGNDQSSPLVFWFTSTRADFEFTSGEHTFTLTFLNQNESVAEKQIKIIINNSHVESLYKSLSPTAEIRIPVEN
jgi:hypothetical protein